jgi:uncharacterized protein (DUF58 family)
MEMKSGVVILATVTLAMIGLLMIASVVSGAKQRGVIIHVVPEIQEVEAGGRAEYAIEIDYGDGAVKFEVLGVPEGWRVLYPERVRLKSVDGSFDGVATLHVYPPKGTPSGTEIKITVLATNKGVTTSDTAVLVVK